MVMYAVQPAASRTVALVKIQFPPLNRANVDIKLDLEMKPAPERCGKWDMGCFIILEPVMNEVAEALMTFTCDLPIPARLNGFDNSVLTIFGRKPSERRKVTVDYQVKVAKGDQFTIFAGQYATIRWEVDMGSVKAVQLKPSYLPQFEQEIVEPVKIQWWKKDDKIETR